MNGHRLYIAGGSEVSMVRITIGVERWWEIKHFVSKWFGKLHFGPNSM